MERRLVAILAADVVGYSRLMGEDEAGTHAALKAHRQELFEPTIRKHKGRIVRLMGDGALVEFASVVDAVECAVAIQQAMAERNAKVPKDKRIEFRIGINLGDVIVDDDDIYGDGVNIAARLEVMADPGGIYVSRTVYNHVKAKTHIGFEDLGEQALKNIEEPIRTYRISGSETASAAAPSTSAPCRPGLLNFSLPERPSIAILPFENLSGEPNQGFLAEGIRLGIQSTLVQLSGLFLINARAVEAYRDRAVPATQAGGELGVRYILEGAVQPAGQRLRVTVQLTDTHARQIIWADRYDHILDDALKLQDDITKEVITSLDVQLLSRESSVDWVRHLTTPEAVEYFYRGVSALYKGTRDDNASARKMFEALYRVQPDSVYGPSGVALTHWVDGFFGWTDPAARSMEQASTWAEKAIEFKDNNGLGHTVLGHLRLVEGKHDEALAYCSSSVALRSNCPLAHGQMANVLNYCGEAQRAVSSARYALELERVYPTWLINVLAAAYRDCGQIGQSIPAAKEAVRLDPRRTEARLILCSDYRLSDRGDEAQRIASEIVTIDPAFRLSDYARRQPYKDPATLERLTKVLRDVGLPE